MARNNKLQTTFIKANRKDVAEDPAVKALRKQLADAEAKAAKAVSAEVDAILIGDNKPTANLQVDASYLKVAIEGAKALCASWRVVEDNAESRKAFENRKARRIAAYNKIVDEQGQAEADKKFVGGNPAVVDQFNRFIGASAKYAYEQAVEEGVSQKQAFLAVMAKYRFYQQTLGFNEAQLDSLIEQAKTLVTA